MDTLKAKLARVSALKAMIDHRLGQLLPDRASTLLRVNGAMGYALMTPGKRLRPLIVTLVASQLGQREEVAIAPACAVEMVHAASLILDDLPCMDDADMRRGQACTHIRYGEDMAMLAAIALLNQAYAVLGKAPDLSDSTRLEMIRVLSRAVGLDGLVAGQESDLRRDGHSSLTRISDIHHRKTSVLFIAAAVLGGLAASASPQELAALERFATELGLAFQALDDVADQGEINVAAARGARGEGQQAGATLISLLGSDGAQEEAQRRIKAAKLELSHGGGRLDSMGAYLDVLLETRGHQGALGRLASD